MTEAKLESAQENLATPALRPARPEDREFVGALARKVFAVYGSYDRYLEEWFDSPEVTTILAEVEGERAGLVMLTAYPNRTRRGEAIADLLAIAVVPAFQSRGVGTALLQKTITVAAGLGPCPVRELHLSVAEGNVRAQRLFARHGFRIAGGEGIYPAGQRALHMIKKLEGP